MAQNVFPNSITESARRGRQPETSEFDANLMLSFPCDLLGVRAGRGAQFPHGAGQSPAAVSRRRPGWRRGRAQWSSAAGSATLVGHSELPRHSPIAIPAKVRWAESSPPCITLPPDWNLIVACDMPEVSAGFLAAAAGPAPGDRRPTSCCPSRPDGRPQPLCAVYHRRALPALEAHFARGVRKVTAALDGLAVERLDVAEALAFSKR